MYAVNCIWFYLLALQLFIQNDFCRIQIGSFLFNQRLFFFKKKILVAKEEKRNALANASTCMHLVTRVASTLTVLHCMHIALHYSNDLHSLLILNAVLRSMCSQPQWKESSYPIGFLLLRASLKTKTLCNAAGRMHSMQHHACSREGGVQGERESASGNAPGWLVLPITARILLIDCIVLDSKAGRVVLVHACAQRGEP